MLQQGAAIAVLVTIIVISHVDAGGVFQLKLRGFENKLGINSAGECCSGHKSAKGVCLNSVCATKFHVCLLQYQNEIGDHPLCRFGERATPVLGRNSFQVAESNATFINPMEFAFNFSWPETFSLVIEAWHEKSGADAAASFEDRHTLVHRMVKRGWLGVGSKWTRDERHLSQPATQPAVLFDYRVLCDEYYYGDKCNVMCKSSDSRFGHYECREDGSRQCYPGWTGDYCTVASCMPGCHSEHGFCDKPYECICSSGWEGKFCDVCTRYPSCLHGTCATAWGCDCKDGWGGLFCDQDLNFCTNHRPCKNGGTCYNTGQGSYTCKCLPGFNGTECEIEEGGCARHPCMNGGTCRDTGHNFTCVCARGWSGHRCETAAETCSDEPCQNGGRCVDELSGYRCVCNKSFKGTNCEQKNTFCQPNTCQNGGNCVNELGGYRCVCPVGFSGRNCHENVNDCAVNPCLNGGTCHDEINAFRCLCVPGFVGSVCQVNVNDCLTNPCANGGTCHDLINDFQCTCRPGFTGRDCSVDIDECAGQHCENGGVCMDRVNAFECRCADGFVGDHCQFEGVIPEWARAVAGSPPAVPVVDAMPSEQVVLISTLSVSVPALVLVSIAAILCMKYRRRRAAEHADDEARRQNAENASTGKRHFEDNMIVNALDYPSGKVKNIDDTGGGGGYGVERTRAQKQINIDPARRASAALQSSSASAAYDKVDFDSACRAAAEPPLKVCVDGGGGPSYGEAAAGAAPGARVNPNRTNGVFVIDEHSRGVAAIPCEEGMYATEV